MVRIDKYNIWANIIIFQKKENNVTDQDPREKMKDQLHTLINISRCDIDIEFVIDDKLSQLELQSR